MSSSRVTKVLWICNLILPRIAVSLGLGFIPKEGWVEGLFGELISERVKGSLDFLPDIAFPLDKKSFLLAGGDIKAGYFSGEYEENGASFVYYAFLEDTAREEIYDPALETIMSRILEEEQPDIVHCFGAEFSHTLAMARALDDPSRLLIGLQGICRECAINYTAHLPSDIVVRHTFRDRLKKDSIYERQQKYFKRSEHEVEALTLAGHIAGRTAFDNAFALEVNPGAVYYHAGENLRNTFYSGNWTRESSERHRIFLSQADYPLKGFHYLIKAVGELVTNGEKYGDKYSDIQIYVAGQSLVSYSSIKDKIKISSYGKYLRDLMSEYGISDRVHILGRLSADEMKEQYLKCDTFVCCSSVENSSNSLGEAMMLQVPIVTAIVGGLGSIFTKDEDGFSYEVYPEDTLESVSDKLRDTLVRRWETQEERTDLRNEIDRRRHNAGFHARENHNPAKNVHELVGIYRKILG